MVNIKELFFGNYKNEDVYVPNVYQRFKNKFLSYRENKKFCSCGLLRYCMFHYCFPSEKEKLKFKTQKNEQV